MCKMSFSADVRRFLETLFSLWLICAASGKGRLHPAVGERKPLCCGLDIEIRGYVEEENRKKIRVGDDDKERGRNRSGRVMVILDPVLAQARVSMYEFVVSEVLFWGNGKRVGDDEPGKKVSRGNRGKHKSYIGGWGV